MFVRSILKHKGAGVITLDAAATVADAVRLLARERIGCIVVTEAGEHLAGIVSERDVVLGLAREGAGFLDRPVSAAMTRDIVTCELDTTVEDLMRRMTHRRIRHLPVVEEGRLSGLVSIGDVVKNRLGELESETQLLRSYIAGV